MDKKIQSFLDQNMMREILYEFYMKGNSGEYPMFAQKVVQEMIEKLQPLFKQS